MRRSRDNIPGWINSNPSVSGLYHMVRVITVQQRDMRLPRGMGRVNSLAKLVQRSQAIHHRHI